MSLLVGLPLALTAPAAPVSGPCDLLDPATASALVAVPIKTGTPTPPAPDEDTDGTMSTWSALRAAAATASGKL